MTTSEKTTFELIEVRESDCAPKLHDFWKVTIRHPGGLAVMESNPYLSGATDGVRERELQQLLERVANRTKPHGARTVEPGINPKEAIGAAKDPLHLLSPTASAATARVLKLGGEKYQPWNWRHTRVNATTYIAAMRRHLDRWQDGEDIDPESGESHIAHVAASCNIMLDAEAFGNLADDRPPKLKKPEQH